MGIPFGRYQHEMFGSIEIGCDKGKLWIHVDRNGIARCRKKRHRLDIHKRYRNECKSKAFSPESPRRGDDVTSIVNFCDEPVIEGVLDKTIRTCGLRLSSADMLCDR